jgi:hypothetical protein
MEKTKTQSVSIPASSSYVFDFIADPETLPQHSLTSAVRVRRRFARNAAAGHAAAAAGDQHRPCRARSPGLVHRRRRRDCARRWPLTRHRARAAKMLLGLSPHDVTTR